MSSLPLAWAEGERKQGRVRNMAPVARQLGSERNVVGTKGRPGSGAVRRSRASARPCWHFSASCAPVSWISRGPVAAQSAFQYRIPL